MKTHFNPKNNPRVIIIQKLYGKFYNEDNDIEFPKHRFKKFIKDIVFGTIERNDLILDELNNKLGFLGLSPYKIYLLMKIYLFL